MVTECIIHVVEQKLCFVMFLDVLFIYFTLNFCEYVGCL